MWYLKEPRTKWQMRRLSCRYGKAGAFTGVNTYKADEELTSSRLIGKVKESLSDSS